MNSNPIRVELDGGVSIAFLLFVAVVGFVALRGIVRLFSGSQGSDSVLKALGVTAMVIVGLGLLAATLVVPYRASQVTVHTARSGATVDVHTAEVSQVEVLDASVAGLPTTTTADGEMLVLPRKCRRSLRVAALAQWCGGVVVPAHAAGQKRPQNDRFSMQCRASAFSLTACVRLLPNA